MNKTNVKLNVLFIDNYDSFVFNLVDEFEKRDCSVSVWRNDITVERVFELYNDLPKPALVVISPGPGSPGDAGCCVDLVKQDYAGMPIFGVCLGHQSMVEACGGSVVGAEAIVHGKSSIVKTVPGSVLFAGMDSDLSVGRYHSLIGKLDTEVTGFNVTATLGDMVMAIEHRERPLMGVQFHPESVLTPFGGKLVDNVIGWAVDLGRSDK